MGRVRGEYLKNIKLSNMNPLTILLRTNISFPTEPRRRAGSETNEMNTTSTTLEPVLDFLARTLTTAETTFNKLPGSAVIQRYVKSSHQNDPGRSLLELILFIFAIRTLLQSRTRADKNFIQFSDKVIPLLPFRDSASSQKACCRKLMNLWTNGLLSRSDNL